MYVTVTVFGWHVEDEGIDGVPLTTHEQADDIFEGIPEHIETILGYPVVCVITDVVYVAQNAVT